MPSIKRPGRTTVYVAPPARRHLCIDVGRWRIRFGRNAWRDFREHYGYDEWHYLLGGRVAFRRWPSGEHGMAGRVVPVIQGDPLAEALAAGEHRQGMAYDADHCGDCAAEALRRRQAACEHANVEVIDIPDFCGSGTYLRTCRECGLSWREEGEWL